MPFDDFFLHAGERPLEDFKLAVEFPNTQAFVPLSVPGDEIGQSRFARGWRGWVVVEGANLALKRLGKFWDQDEVEILGREMAPATADGHEINQPLTSIPVEDAAKENGLRQVAIAAPRVETMRVGRRTVALINEHD